MNKFETLELIKWETRGTNLLTRLAAARTQAEKSRLEIELQKASTAVRRLSPAAIQIAAA